jgi:hypothetical protein
MHAFRTLPRINAARRIRAAIGLATLCPLLALAQMSSAGFQVPRQSIDGGATRAASATFTLVASVGQPDAGSAMTGGAFTLRGGFQRAVEPAGPAPDPLFADGFEPR